MSRYRAFAGGVAVAGVLAAASFVWAGNTGTTALFKPIGNTVSSESGDYVSTSSGGLNSYFTYFIEVPPGQSRLVVDIFDADVGAGGDSDRTGNRDWDYAGTGFTGTTSYSLRTPGGTILPARYALGSTVTPAGGDNGWLTVFDSSDTGGTFRDQFDTRSYSNNNGSYFWPETWVEVGDDGTAQSPTGGSIQILNNVSDYQLRVRRNATGNSNASIYRRFGLLGATSATLTFAYRRDSMESGDHVYVEASTNGTTWTTLTGGDIAGTGTNDPATYPTASIDLASYVGQTTVYLRLRTAVNADNDTVWFDNVQVQTANATTPVTAGHWELRVDLSDSGGDEISAFGLRAHDGDSGASGTEYNVYYQPYTQFGVDNVSDTFPDTVAFTNYPWVTSGCSCYANNWDGDGAGTFAFDRPDRTTNPAGWVQVGGTIAASGSSAWGHNTITGWTSNPDAPNYGIWRLRHQSIEWSAGAGNIYTFYMTDYNNPTAPPPPPTAQQQANSMRVYLPTDAGAAPVKPYLEQFVRISGGPAVTPVVGTTYRLTVTVRVVNPTPHPITFSAANIVTANVPGTIATGTVVYAGNLQYSQGSAPTTPGLGSSGNITWDPGTLAVGGTALLAYQVDATPTAAGTLRVTGTPTSGGTTARYVDETGSSAARALVTLGPVCEVAISTSAPTQAVLAGLWSHRHADGLVVSFMTASEVGTAGYRLERLSRSGNAFEVATDRPFLPALPAAPQGAVYRVVDREADPRVPQTYRVVEVEAAGSERDLGTYTLTPEDGPAPPMAAGFVRAPRERRPAPELPAGSEPLTAMPVSGLKIAVESPGLHWVGAEEIATGLALPLRKVREMVQARGFALTNREHAVAWLQGANGSGLYFVGEPIDSIYSRANVYVLKPGAGVLMMPQSSVPLPASLPLRVSAAALHAESDLFELMAAPLDPESDYWFWDYLEAGSTSHGRRSFTVDAPAVSPAGGQATLAANLLGATSTGVAGEHRAIVYINGVQVGESAWQGVAAHQVAATFDQSLLHEGANTVEVEAHLEGGVPYSFIFVDSFDLTYQRTHTARASALEVQVGGGRSVMVEGFADPAVRVFDLSDPMRPAILPKVQVAPGGVGFTATFSTTIGRSGALKPLLAVSEAGVKRPVRTWRDSASNLRSAGNAADYLVVTAGPLVATAEQLAAYREGQGLAAAVVDIEDVYDEFNAGLPSPHALRSFLAYAREGWAVAPRAVVLAGTGSYDYKDVLGLGGNLVPPLMVTSPGGIFASDLRFGDVVGDDGVPEIAIGRLPVASSAELADAIAKIVAYEAEGAAPWTGAAVVVADDPEDGFDFGRDSDTLAARLGGLTVEKLYLGPLTAAEVRTRLHSAIHEGASVVTYLGHGGMDRWAQESLFSASDVATLSNGPRLPLVASMTCVIGRFEVPGFECLGSAFLRPTNAGAIGVWAPSGVANHADSLLLGQVFSESLGRDDVPTVGDACIRALAGFHSGGGNPTTGRLYNYFGDPMIRLRPLPPPPPPEPGGDPGAP